MFRPMIIFKGYLESVQHEDVVSEDVFLNDIDMIPDLKEEEVETVKENIFESRLMGPESSGMVKGVGSGVTSNHLNAKRKCQSGTEPSDSEIVSLLLKENREAYIKDTGQIENSTILRDNGGAIHTSRSLHVVNQVSQQRRSAKDKEDILVDDQNNLWGKIQLLLVGQIN
ncbi:hypothetical protein Cgig2_001915 [Carnegiea gigantea]|uniref:Uncharacterized protein n=1 Tax=Carnegiea gigantea TaxID=171969 RepID=A0A9Q1K8C1_9CARY|nr:hypothetical protein Cgig2_001915 [Carnegiea gigantea]